MIGALNLALIPQVSDAKTVAEGRMPLWGELSLSDPIFLLILPVAAFALLRGRASARHAAGRVPVLPDVLPRSWIQRMGWLPTLLKAAALTLAVIAVSRPLRGNVELSSSTEGIDIALLVDRSSSMEARRSRRDPTRFEIVKEVVGDFALRRMTDREGAADNIALISFAYFPELLCPFTLDADALTGVLEGLETEKRRELDATGIGIALAKAVAVLRESDSESRIVVLLTDGKENVERIMPLDAARLAAEAGIRVYAVFAGPKVETRTSLFGGRTEIPVDTTELETIARMTEGRFYHAESQRDLEAVYEEIEALERTERTETSYAEYFDLYPRLLLIALICYLTYWLSICSWARRLP